LSSLYIDNCSFQTSIFKELNKQFINKNLIISPLSAYQILSLAANGAEENTLTEMVLALGGKSLEEINKINLQILNEAKDFSTVEIANAIMTKFKPNKKFLAAGQKYGASVETLKSASQVNSWCNAKTHGKIKKILDKLESNIRMILLNAVYFKGFWYKPFEKSLTMKRPFYNLNNESQVKRIDKMQMTDDFRYYEDKEVQLVELPYKKDSMSAIIILPNEKKNINEFISEFNDEKLQRLLKRMVSKKVNLHLPKFELEFSSELNSVLIKLGMNDAFNENTANFNGLEKELCIDKVIQKTYLKVDEAGTEAAAVTVIKMKFYGASIKRRPKIYSMIVDRPFLFLLKNKKLPVNNEMLFMSKIETL
jgi:serpin B